MQFLVIGGGGHAKVVIEAIRAIDGEVVGVIDASPGKGKVLGAPIVGDDDDLPSLRAQGLEHVALGLGANALRERIGRRVKELGFVLPPIVHPSALLSPTAKIGEGVVVMARAVVGVETILREMSLVNTGAVLDHDNHLGVAAHVAPGCALAGNVRVGDRALVGVGAAVRPGVRIGADAIVGAGSAVVCDVDEGACVAGAPAKPIRVRGADPKG
jgi:UDP-perosamine 4-acetyltransferase